MLLFKPKNGKKEQGKLAIPEGLWIKCPSCSEIIYKKELERNLEVCPKCNYHFRINADRRINITFDEGSFKSLFEDITPQDLLDFTDTKKYRDRLKEDSKKTGLSDAVISGEGTIDKIRVAATLFDFNFMGGSMGRVVGEKIAKTFEYAIQKKLPVIIFSSSGGARMQEGIFSLMQMAKTVAFVSEFQKVSLPYISVVTDPTTGGVSASFASLGDVIIAEPKALIGFAGPRVIEKTIHQSLPEGFQRSEYLLEHGMIDMIVERKDIKNTLKNLLLLLVNE
ncbi:MAG: acetyl-CoA carboxylase carboxyltransferase subunit beta [Candidatus Acidulodesulfobacterium ferriphilum]|jgi:acetyl-CoA carboxylase carboxyl transferase subunit beta|uniref:Acetyl-coenzyme A carboxylase carboxyl transferase subunit beta n=1 Tax=Candidatus Acidulodesulfobacterium ferriphilum TaxID=2597223 RepID=A0A519BCY0_9DELT|nr:acetyl-CoA carboxylase, carboxyltransferase subunit beta [Deltaproteobacteria bacterium]MCL5892181.1 acetyl-CoA carboxylase, carboxyltransferase subunit beta [Deltaproteobacteria bacterium]RZD15133.1 MAG: acetyl-CoA carboxylase carboxyltransferase subunit beta [Candidatus Acidulodesulfobacterium ferriphilum]